MMADLFEKKWVIYVLELEGERFYVGRTTEKNLSYRLHDHETQSDNSAKFWTMKHKVVKRREELFRYNASPFEEDMMVKEMMAVYGVDNVGGGSYPLETRTPEQRKFIENEISGALDQCLYCKE